MKVKELIDALTVFEKCSNGEDMDVIITGYNGNGLSLDRVYLSMYGVIDNYKKVKQPEHTICLDIGAYLVEDIDIGEDKTYVDEDTYNDFKEE